MVYLIVLLQPISFRTVEMMSIAIALLLHAIGVPGTSFSREYALFKWNFVDFLDSEAAMYWFYLIYGSVITISMFPIYFTPSAVALVALLARVGSSILAPILYLALPLPSTGWFIWKLNQMNFVPMIFVVGNGEAQKMIAMLSRLSDLE